MTTTQPGAAGASARQVPGAVSGAEQAPAAAASAVRARGLRLHGARGIVYGPVDLDVAPGELTVLHGPQGGGRSSLLLTLAGRMRPDAGSELVVLGTSLPRGRRAVQRAAAVAGFSGVDDLDESVTVASAVRERLTWLSPWYRRVPRVGQGLVDAATREVFGPRPSPRAGSVIWDLDEVDVMLLRISLAMLQQPRLLVVDDVDQVHDTVRRRFVWSRLDAVAATGVTVVASVASYDEVERTDWHRRPQVVFLATGPHALPGASPVAPSTPVAADATPAPSQR